MIKKILLIIVIILVVGLFANGIRSFFFSPQYVENSETDNAINNNSPNNKKNSISELPKTKETAGIFEGFKQFLINPTQQKEELEKKVEINPTKESIQNYFNETAKIIFPSNEDLQSAISGYLITERPKDLENIIDYFKKANTELYNVNYPPEVQNIHNNSIWITSEIIKILENIAGASSREEINNVINGSNLKEIKNKTLETRTEIQALKTKYNLDIVL